jgi:phosphatidylglycerophosphate synthase
MWLAHALTLSRIPLAVALVAAYGETTTALVLIALAALTDTADGNVARWMQRHGHTEPDIGGWLDPLVDKLFVAIVLAAIWLRSGDAVVIALIGARELLLLPLAAIYLAKHHPLRDIHAAPIGKLATIAQFVAIAVAIAAPSWALATALLAAALGIAAVVHYARYVRPVDRVS